MRLSPTLILGQLLVLFLVGCEALPEARPIPDRSFGMEPVYIDSVQGRTIRTFPPTGILDGRAFAVLGDTLFIVDQLRGIHIIDNSDPSSPVGISFIDIPGCTSVAVNGNFLYVNNLVDLVTLDISDPLEAIEVDREADLYPRPLEFPEGYIGYFACYDPSLGLLAGWEEGNINSPECYIE